MLETFSSFPTSTKPSLNFVDFISDIYISQIILLSPTPLRSKLLTLSSAHFDRRNYFQMGAVKTKVQNVIHEALHDWVPTAVSSLICYYVDTFCLYSRHTNIPLVFVLPMTPQVLRYFLLYVYSVFFCLKFWTTISAAPPPRSVH